MWCCVLWFLWQTAGVYWFLLFDETISPLDLPPDLKFWIIFCKMVRRLFPFFSARVETGQGNGSYRDPFHGARTDSIYNRTQSFGWCTKFILRHIELHPSSVQLFNLHSVQSLIKCEDIICIISTTATCDSIWFDIADLCIVSLNVRQYENILQSV